MSIYDMKGEMRASLIVKWFHFALLIIEVWASCNYTWQETAPANAHYVCPIKFYSTVFEYS